MKSAEKYKLPFDQYSRQVAVLGAINAVRKGTEKFTVLDVGGYKGVTAQLHNQDPVTVLDVFDIDETNYVKGDARDMEFHDNSFDFVVSFDVFEHILIKDREKVIAECCRVAKKGVFIAAPVRLPANEYAERALNEAHKKLHNKEHQWLKEHIDYQLPEVGLAEEMLRKEGLETFLIGSNEITAWTQMQGAIFVATKYPEALGSLQKLNEAYNRRLQPDEASNIDSNYRHIVVGLKASADFKTLEKHMTNRQKNIRENFGVEVTENVLNYYIEILAVLDKKTEDLKAENESLKQENHRLNERNKRIKRHPAVRAYKKIKSIKLINGK
jgi:predicted SAM-dependent methyltransferase